MLTATFCENKRKTQTSITKKQTIFSYRITELATLLGSLISEVYLRIRSLYFQLFALYALYLWVCIGVTIDPNSDLGISF